MSTDGNALAGSLAATLQATEIAKLLDAAVPEHSIAGSEVLFDPFHQVHYRSRLERNPKCRFSHERYFPQKTSNLTLREAFALTTPGPIEQKSLSVPDGRFVSRLICAACDHEEKLWKLRDSLDVFSLACPKCATPRTIRGFDLTDRLLGAGLTPEDLGRSLADLGLRGGEVFYIEASHAEQHFMLANSNAGDIAPGGIAVVVAGQGNIGSFLAPHLARLRGVSRVVLCDPDIYEPGQQVNQDIPADAVGRAKAEVQAERLRAIQPGLDVVAFVAPVESLPLGMLGGAIVVSCLDSRAARQHLASRAWRIGSPFVDAAVGGGSSLLVRTNVYIPSPDAACFECAFDDRDYEQLEQIFPCNEIEAEGRSARPRKD